MYKMIAACGLVFVLSACGAADTTAQPAPQSNTGSQTRPTTPPADALPTAPAGLPTLPAGPPTPPSGPGAGIPGAGKQYSAYPAMAIDPAKQYFATIATAKGPIKVELFPKSAPKTVNNFVFLAREGFYNGVTFHRVLPGFMAQGGDPTGTGAGGPGYEFENEYDPELKVDFTQEGVMAMANAGPNTNGSQFFITFGPVSLDAKDYTIFGKVVEGMDVVKQITLRDPNSGPNLPPGDVMTAVTIEEK